MDSNRIFLLYNWNIEFPYERQQTDTSRLHGYDYLNYFLDYKQLLFSKIIFSFRFRYSKRSPTFFELLSAYDFLTLVIRVRKRHEFVLQGLFMSSFYIIYQTAVTRSFPTCNICIRNNIIYYSPLMYVLPNDIGACTLHTLTYTLNVFTSQTLVNVKVRYRIFIYLSASVFAVRLVHTTQTVSSTKRRAIPCNVPLFGAKYVSVTFFLLFVFILV